MKILIVEVVKRLRLKHSDCDSVAAFGESNGTFPWGRVESVWIVLIALVVCGVYIGRAAEHSAPGASRSAALREWAPLPKVRTRIDPSYQYPSGFSFNGEPLDHRRIEPPRERLAELRVRLNREADKGALWLEISEVQERLGDTNGLTEARQTAEQWFRKQIAGDPTNGRLRTQLAEALPISRQDEALALLREGVRLSPEDSMVWTRLAWRLTRDCQAQLDQVTDLSGMTMGPGDLAILQRRRAEAALARMSLGEQRQLRAQFVEIRDAFARATQASIRNPEAFVGRWMFEATMAPTLQAALIDSAGWRSVTDGSRMFSPQGLQVLRPVVHCATNEPFALIYAGMLVTAGSLGDQRDVLMKQDVMPLLPVDDRRWVEDCFAQLQAAAGSADPQVQRGARLGLAALQSAVRADPGRAVTEALSAARLLPGCEQAWDLALGCASLAGWTTNALPLADEALSHLDIPTLRLHRGRIRMQLAQLAEAETDLRAALGQRPDDAVVQLALACLLLKRGAKPDLAAARLLLDRLPAANDSQASLEPEVSLARAIHLGLTDRTSEGKKVLYQLLALMPSESRILRVLEAYREP